MVVIKCFRNYQYTPAWGKVELYLVAQQARDLRQQGDCGREENKSIENWIVLMTTCLPAGRFKKYNDKQLIVRHDFF